MKKGLFYHNGKSNKDLQRQKIRKYMDYDITLEQVNDNLRHDEHLDFAVQTDMINSAFILARNENPSSSNPNVHIAGGNREYGDQRLIEYRAASDPSLALETEHLGAALRKAEDYKPAFFDQFILDIDCDYFNTEESLYPGDTGAFDRLVRQSGIITIALEPECVKICRTKGSSLTSEMILERLLCLIEAA